MNIDNKKFRIKDGTLLQYKDKNLGSVIIPKGVKVIGERAFENCRIESVEFPDTLIKIDRRAFRWCMYLKSVRIPDSVKSIENEAFRECPRLEHLELGNGVKKIGCRAFHYCENIFGTVSGNSVNVIGAYAFQSCKNIKRIEFPECKSVGDSSFSCCFEMEYAEVGNPDIIGNQTFYFCKSLKNFMIPESVKQIRQSAFKFCDALALKVPESLRQSDSIAKDAFYNCREIIWY